MFADNPAGRLHNHITAFLHFQVPNSPQHPSVIWASALGIPSGEATPRFVQRLAALIRLPEEILAELAKVDPGLYDHDFVTRWTQKVPGGIAPALFSPMNSAQVAERFDPASLASLESCSYVLHQHRPQRVFADDELARINELIESLLTELEESAGIDADLRDFLWFHATELANAIRDIDVRGPAAVEAAFDQAVGAAQRRMDLTVRAAKENMPAWQKFFNVIVAIAAALQIATSSLALPGQIQQELDGPSQQRPPAVEVVIQGSVVTGAEHSRVDQHAGATVQDGGRQEGE